MSSSTLTREQYLRAERAGRRAFKGVVGSHPASRELRSDRADAAYWRRTMARLSKAEQARLDAMERGGRSLRRLYERGGAGAGAERLKPGETRA